MQSQPTASTRQLALLLYALLPLAATATADPHDHDRARAALERGEVLPLAQILETVTAEVPGDIIEFELEREHGVWVYEVKLIAPDGRVLEVYVDAADGRVLTTEEDD